MANRRPSTRRGPSAAALPAALILAVAGCASSGAGDDAGGESGDEASASEDTEEESKLHRYSFDDVDANQETGERIEGGEEAEFVAPDGSAAQLSDYRGRPVVLVFNRGFVGFVCPYCATYTAQIAARYDELRDLGAEVLLVYPTEEDDPEVREQFVGAVEDILAQEGKEALPFPVFLDPGLQATTQFNLIGDLTRPSTFVLDADGVVQYAYVGREPDERPAVDRIVMELQALAQ